MSINWEKNPAYPLSFNTCRECGHQGLIKLAWDLHGHLCVDAKPCLARMVKQHTRHQEIVQEVASEGDGIVWNVPKENETLSEQLGPTFELDDEFKPFFEPVTTNKAVNGLQHFVCEKCCSAWSRPATRGRPPKVCPTCR